MSWQCAPAAVVCSSDGAHLVVSFHWRLSSPQDTGEGITALSGNDADSKTHVVVLVNGLFGTAENWTVVVEKLRERLDGAALASTLIMASMASSRTETYDGIDRCALSPGAGLKA